MLAFKNLLWPDGGPPEEECVFCLSLQRQHCSSQKDSELPVSSRSGSCAVCGLWMYIPVQNDEEEPGPGSRPVARTGWWVRQFLRLDNNGRSCHIVWRGSLTAPPHCFISQECGLNCISSLTAWTSVNYQGLDPRDGEVLSDFFSLLSKTVFTFPELWLTDSFSWCCKNFLYALEFISFISKRPKLPSKTQWSEPHLNTILLG